MPSLNWRLQDLLVAVCGLQFPDQGSNLGPLNWEQRDSAAGPAGKSLMGWLSQRGVAACVGCEAL